MSGDSCVSNGLRHISLSNDYKQIYYRILKNQRNKSIILRLNTDEEKHENMTRDDDSNACTKKSFRVSLGWEKGSYVMSQVEEVIIDVRESWNSVKLLSNYPCQ